MRTATRLGIGDPTMRFTLWKERGGTYSIMLDLVRWRKKVGRKEELPLNDAILNEHADTTGPDELLPMSEGNWQERCKELAELVR